MGKLREFGPAVSIVTGTFMEVGGGALLEKNYPAGVAVCGLGMLAVVNGVAWMENRHRAEMNSDPEPQSTIDPLSLPISIHHHDLVGDDPISWGAPTHL